MNEEKRPAINWMDVLWLLFLAGLAALPPVFEIHKQLVLLAFGLLQLSEGWVLSKAPQRGAAYIVLLKIALATLLIDHTGEVGINSSYWPIFFLPAVTAAEYFSPWATLLWTALAATAYCSYLYPALEEYEITREGYGILAIRILFFFLAGMIVNRFMVENRRQTKLYQTLAETLTEINRRLEQAQEEARRSERLAALGQMSAGLAHELRNPLAVIKGSAETLTRKLASSDPITTELAGYISSEVNRMNALVTRFLDFARPHKLEERLEQIPPLIERALKAARDRWPDAKVEVERQFAPVLPEVTLDAELIERVFTNLALNAYEAMGPGGGKLRVAVVPCSDGQRGVEITFQDSGPGIPTELREQIFNPFFTTKE